MSNIKLPDRPLVMGPYSYDWGVYDADLADGANELGCLLHKAQRIEIDTTPATPVVLHTIAHEIAHAIQITFGMDADESPAEAIGSGLALLFLDNPATVRFLQKLAATVNRGG